MGSLKFKAYHRILATRERCAACDGEYKLSTIFKGALVFEAIIIALVILG